MVIGHEGWSEIPPCESCRQLKELLRKLRQNTYNVYWLGHSSLGEQNPETEELLEEIDQVLKGD